MVSCDDVALRLLWELGGRFARTTGSRVALCLLGCGLRFSE